MVVHYTFSYILIIFLYIDIIHTLYWVYLCTVIE